MSYNRKHVERFVAALNFTPAEGDAIKKRAEEAAVDYSSAEEGDFSGGSLGEVLGKPELVKTFDDMWEKQRLVLDAS